MFKKIEIFHDFEADANAATAAGKAFLVALYNGSFDKNALDLIRYQHFTKYVSTNKFNLVHLQAMLEASTVCEFIIKFRCGIADIKILNNMAGKKR